ncbi:MAG: hypothetical protein ACTSYB_00165 [Candidatus Helarchaeota archaeon]
MSQNQKNESIDEIKILESGFGKFIAVQFIVVWVSLFIPVILAYFILVYFPILLQFPYFFLLIPIGIGLFFLTLFTSLLVAVLALNWCNRKFPPREGSFDIDLNVSDTRGWMYRRNIKAFTIRLFGLVPINALKVLMLRAFGLKIGKNVKLYGMVVDDPFIEIGNNFILSKRAVIAGHLYDHYKLTFHKTIIGNNVIIEPVAGAVGAVLGDNVIIRKGCGALRGQRTRGDGIFEGVPMRRVGRVSDLSPDEFKKIKESVIAFSKRDLDKEKIAPIKISYLKLNLCKLLIILVGSSAAIGIGILFYYTIIAPLYFGMGGFIGRVLALCFMPIFILIMIAFFLTFSVITTKLLITSVPEGTYELDSQEARTWKFSYLLKKFCIRLVDATIFDVADVFVLQFFGNKIGKNVILKEGIVDPEYLEIGDYVNISALSRVHTHNIIEGKLVLKGVKIGNNVILGGVSHLDVGCEVGAGTLLGIATYCKPNEKLKPNSLYIGNPPAKLPKELLKKMWIEPKKEEL